MIKPNRAVFSVGPAHPVLCMLPVGRSRLALAGASLAYGTGLFVAYEASRPKPPLLTCEQRRDRFAELAQGYDGDVHCDEQSSGILAWRQELVAQARGRVLEIAGGTGRNLEHFPAAVSELVVGDNCEAMLQVAARRVAEARVGGGAACCPSAVTLAVMDASALPFADDSFDTVVDTFGVCSFEAPVQALREMGRCCKPGGAVLLLEHGASSLAPLRWWQERAEAQLRPLP